MSKITVITATYNILTNNRENSFIKMIDSIQNQTYHSIEHLIIDGASNDGSLEFINNLITKYNATNIKIFSAPDTGIYNAYNKGIQHSQGKYIIFINSDDYFYKNDSLQMMIREIENTRSDFICSAIITSNNKTITPLMQNYLIKTPFCHQSMLTKKKLLQDFNYFDESYKYAADYAFIVNILAAKTKYSIIKTPLIYYGDEGLSAQNKLSTINDIIDIAYNKIYSNIISKKETCNLLKRNNHILPCLKILASSYFTLSDKLFLLKRAIKTLLRFRFIIVKIENYIRTREN